MLNESLNLTSLLRQRLAPYPRTIGRYSSSELYYILNGEKTPEEWLNPKPFPLALLLAMWNGMIVHEYVQELLLGNGTNEQKFIHEHTLPDGEVITLVAKIDHLPNTENTVWEFKTSKNELPEAKKEHEFQAKLYCTIAERPQGKIFQPVQHWKSGLFLQHIGTVERDDVWFQEQMKKLEEFHYKVKALQA